MNDEKCCFYDAIASLNEGKPDCNVDRLVEILRRKRIAVPNTTLQMILLGLNVHGRHQNIPKAFNLGTVSGYIYTLKSIEYRTMAEVRYGDDVILIAKISDRLSHIDAIFRLTTASHFLEVGPFAK